jgi:regulator of sigma E protease
LLRPGERVEIDFVRGGSAMAEQATLGRIEQADRFGNHFMVGQLGVEATAPVVTSVGLFEAPVVGVRRARELIQVTIDGIGQIVTGRRSVKDLNGPVGTARIAGEQMTLGVDAFVALIAVVSINLGFINLLPVPMLDGGHLLFYAIEAVRRRPLRAEAQEWAFRGGLAALVALILVVTVNDLGAFGLWKNLAGLIG